MFPLCIHDLDDDAWVSLVDVLTDRRRRRLEDDYVRLAIRDRGICAIDRWGRIIPACTNLKDTRESLTRVFRLLREYERDCYHIRSKGYAGARDPDSWLQHHSPLQRFGWVKGNVPRFCQRGGVRIHYVE